MKKVLDYIDNKNNTDIKLKQEYIKACKSVKFRELIKNINASEDILMKYTSKLEESSIEFDHCLNCPGLDYCKNNINGYMYTPFSNGKTIDFEYRACKYMNKKINDEKYMQNIELFQMPSSLKNASLKDLYTDDKDRLEVIRYFKKVLEGEENKGLYLHGRFGTGKTYLIAALFNELAKKKHRSAIIYYPEFLRSLKESFDSDYKEKFNFIKKVEYLLIDDIGAEVVTPWGRDEILGSILQYRMEEGLTTFFTSNLNVEELEEHLSMSSKGVERVKARRIIERIQYMCHNIKIDSVNRRKIS